MAARKRRRTAMLTGALVVILLVTSSVLIFSLRVPDSPGLTTGKTATPTLIASLCPVAADPLPFVAAEGAGAGFPCPPTRSVLQVTTPLGNIEVVYYVSELDHSRYEIMVANYGTVFGGDLTGILRSIVMERTRASTMDEYQLKEKSKQDLVLNGSSGQLVNADDGKRAARFKLYVVGKRLYRIAVITTLVKIDESQFTTFLDSFMIPHAP